MVAGLNDYDVTKWLTVVPFPYGPADFGDFLAFLDGRPVYEALAICEDDRVLGVTGIGDSLGYWLARAYHGRGVMTEAAGALVDWYFSNTDAEVLVSGYFDGNDASRKVLSKIGFLPTGATVATHCISRQQKLDLVKMALKRSVWEARA